MVEKKNAKLCFYGKNIVLTMLLCFTSLAFIACASMIKAKTLVTTIPLEEQAQIIIDNYLILKNLDGETRWMSSSSGKYVINIPAGTHTFIFNFRASGSDTSYSATDLKHTDTFEPGRLYHLMPQWNDGMTRVWVVTSQGGYSELMKPGPDETLVVIRRKNGGLLSGQLGYIDVFVDGAKEKYTRTYAGLTYGILFQRGEHKFTMDGITITINAGGGTKQFFLYSSPVFGKTTIKEKQK